MTVPDIEITVARGRGQPDLRRERPGGARPPCETGHEPVRPRPPPRLPEGEGPPRPGAPPLRRRHPRSRARGPPAPGVGGRPGRTSRSAHRDPQVRNLTWKRRGAADLRDSGGRQAGDHARALGGSGEPAPSPSDGRPVGGETPRPPQQKAPWVPSPSRPSRRLVEATIQTSTSASRRNRSRMRFVLVGPGAGGPRGPVDALDVGGAWEGTLRFPTTTPTSAARPDAPGPGRPPEVKRQQVPGAERRLRARSRQLRDGRRSAPRLCPRELEAEADGGRRRRCAPSWSTQRRAAKQRPLPPSLRDRAVTASRRLRHPRRAVPVSSAARRWRRSSRRGCGVT